MVPGVEVVVVDGASPDGTQAVMQPYLLSNPAIRYFREKLNSGVDRDYDKAVYYAEGQYCWLMTDDDLLQPGAIAKVMATLSDGYPDLVVVNSQVRNQDCTVVLQDRLIELSNNRNYALNEGDQFFFDAIKYLSFIGGVVIRKSAWISRDRSSYFGTLFVHIGVIFQHPPIAKVIVISEPLIIIRYGNAMWTARSFEIWMFKWPDLIWSFPDYSEFTKRIICSREPWRSIKTLLRQRALGSYSLNEFKKFIPGNAPFIWRSTAYIVSRLPASLLNTAALIHTLLKIKKNRIEIFDLAHSRNANFIMRKLAGFFLKDTA